MARRASPTPQLASAAARKIEQGKLTRAEVEQALQTLNGIRAGIERATSDRVERLLNERYQKIEQIISPYLDGRTRYAEQDAP